MRKQRIYLDTSVISHLDADDTPEKMDDTLRLWEQIQAGEYEVVLSEVVFAEIGRCADYKKDYLTSYLRQIQYTVAESGDDVALLANKFINLGLLKGKSLNDCRHIAAALLSGCDIIVSWNFKHFVNARTIDGIRRIALVEGFKDITIYSPTMLIEGGYENE